jgi:hypothetical protein
MLPMRLKSYAHTHVGVSGMMRSVTLSKPSQGTSMYRIRYLVRYLVVFGTLPLRHYPVEVAKALLSVLSHNHFVACVT